MATQIIESEEPTIEDMTEKLQKNGELEELIDVSGMEVVDG